MARLRIRIELNRGGVGVPLHKLSSVVQEAQKFFQMVAEDVHVENQGEWLAFDFDNESLNFTAEYVGPVTAEQVRAFYAAFDGVTSLRRATIAQFTRIADAIGEDELIGFGLYGSDQELAPSRMALPVPAECAANRRRDSALARRGGRTRHASSRGDRLGSRGAALQATSRARHTGRQRPGQVGWVCARGRVQFRQSNQPPRK